MGFIALSLAGAALSPASAQGTVKATFQDWEIRCDRPAGASIDQCVLMQSVVAEDRPNVGLAIIVLKTVDRQARFLRILGPLGVLLQPGLGLKIDNADIGRTGFARCMTNGCLAEVLLDDALLAKLRTGKEALFVIFQIPEEGIGIPISLAGFAAGFDALP